MTSSFPIAPAPIVVCQRFSLKHPDLPQVARYFSNAVRKLGSSHYERLFQLSRELADQERRQRSVTGHQLYLRTQALLSSAPVSGGMGSPDMNVLTIMVLLEAAQDQDQDLEAIMAATKAQTAAKQALRALIANVNRDVAQNAAQGITDAPTQSPFWQTSLRATRHW